jgi:hypothetical protein
MVRAEEVSTSETSVCVYQAAQNRIWNTRDILMTVLRIRIVSNGVITSDTTNLTFSWTTLMMEAVGSVEILIGI